MFYDILGSLLGTGFPFIFPLFIFTLWLRGLFLINSHMHHAAAFPVALPFYDCEVPAGYPNVILSGNPRLFYKELTQPTSYILFICI